MKPRKVDKFPDKGNHVGDLIILPSGQVYQWIKFKRWQRAFSKEETE